MANLQLYYIPSECLNVLPLRCTAEAFFFIIFLLTEQKMKLRSDAAKLSILCPGAFFFFFNHFSKINKSTSGAWSTKTTTALCKNAAVNNRTEVSLAAEEGDGGDQPLGNRGWEVSPTHHPNTAGIVRWVWVVRGPSPQYASRKCNQNGLVQNIPNINEHHHNRLWGNSGAASSTPVILFSTVRSGGCLIARSFNWRMWGGKFVKIHNFFRTLWHNKVPTCRKENISHTSLSY